jgi:hypothetical protein
VKKNQGFEKGQKGKGVTNKGLTTKSTPSEPNSIEMKFACVETLMMNMVALGEIQCTYFMQN